LSFFYLFFLHHQGKKKKKIKKILKIKMLSVFCSLQWKIFTLTAHTLMGKFQVQIWWDNIHQTIQPFFFLKKMLRNQNIVPPPTDVWHDLYQCWADIWKIRIFDRISKLMFDEYRCE
jgi:hypothetical protein